VRVEQQNGQPVRPGQDPSGTGRGFSRRDGLMQVAEQPPLQSGLVKVGAHAVDVGLELRQFAALDLGEERLSDRFEAGARLHGRRLPCPAETRCPRDGRRLGAVLRLPDGRASRRQPSFLPDTAQESQHESGIAVPAELPGAGSADISSSPVQSGDTRPDRSPAPRPANRPARAPAAHRPVHTGSCGHPARLRPGRPRGGWQTAGWSPVRMRVTVSRLSCGSAGGRGRGGEARRVGVAAAAGVPASGHWLGEGAGPGEAEGGDLGGDAGCRRALGRGGRHVHIFAAGVP
jgi:hypothetical protein